MTDGTKYKIRPAGPDVFGKPLYQACTFGIELVAQPVRRVLGTFRHRADAQALLDAVRARVGDAEHVTQSEAKKWKK